jgi:hypothetical protein
LAKYSYSFLPLQLYHKIGPNKNWLKNKLATTYIVSDLLMNFCLQAKQQIFIGSCRKNGDHTYDNLAKFGCNPDSKYKKFNNLSIFLATQ